MHTGCPSLLEGRTVCLQAAALALQSPTACTAISAGPSLDSAVEVSTMMILFLLSAGSCRAADNQQVERAGMSDLVPDVRKEEWQAVCVV